MRVGEPDQLGVERAHEQLPLGAWFVELPEPHRHVAADDGRASTCLDDDDLRASGVWPGAGTSRIPGSSSTAPSTGT